MNNNIVKEKVVSGVFGVGEVVQYEKKDSGNQYISVDFGTNLVKFAYPACFEKHLKAVSDDLKVAVEAELAKEKAQKLNISTNTYIRLNNSSVCQEEEKINLKNTNVSALVRHKAYGTSAQRIYVDFCDKYGWDIDERGKFGKQQRLFSEVATPEGYSVWFLAHSNLTETSNGKWKNEFSGDVLYEKWESDVDGLLFSVRKIKRVVFAKIKDVGMKYYFMGIYIFEKIEPVEGKSGVYIRTFRRIGDTYPER